ncbi:hypothetical protein PR048_030898 [Dryococelus australis]|uniref:Transmembrane protein n=1 Tax=Dryococelus australis TaxID=614101 RepID=A0ABQ9GD04_9NEOP|nr:hypothetical protein PR048_030898 [Dryococelus australis]
MIREINDENQKISLADNVTTKCVRRMERGLRKEIFADRERTLDGQGREEQCPLYTLLRSLIAKENARAEDQRGIGRGEEVVGRVTRVCRELAGRTGARESSLEGVYEQTESVSGNCEGFTEQRRNEEAGVKGRHPRKPHTSGITRHDSHMRKYRSDPAGDRDRFARVEGEMLITRTGSMAACRLATSGARRRITFLSGIQMTAKVEFGDILAGDVIHGSVQSRAEQRIAPTRGIIVCVACHFLRSPHHTSRVAIGGTHPYGEAIRPGNSATLCVPHPARFPELSPIENVWDQIGGPTVAVTYAEHPTTVYASMTDHIAGCFHATGVPPTYLVHPAIHAWYGTIFWCSLYTLPCHVPVATYMPLRWHLQDGQFNFFADESMHSEAAGITSVESTPLAARLSEAAGTERGREKVPASLSLSSYNPLSCRHGDHGTTTLNEGNRREDKPAQRHLTPTHTHNTYTAVYLPYLHTSVIKPLENHPVNEVLPRPIEALPTTTPREKFLPERGFSRHRTIDYRRGRVTSPRCAEPVSGSQHSTAFVPTPLATPPANVARLSRWSYVTCYKAGQLRSDVVTQAATTHVAHKDDLVGNKSAEHRIPAATTACSHCTCVCRVEKVELRELDGSDEGEMRREWSSASEYNGGGKREILEKIRRPAASSGTIPTCNPGVTRRDVATSLPPPQPIRMSANSSLCNKITTRDSSSVHTDKDEICTHTSEEVDLTESLKRPLTTSVYWRPSTTACPQISTSLVAEKSQEQGWYIIIALSWYGAFKIVVYLLAQRGGQREKQRERERRAEKERQERENERERERTRDNRERGGEDTPSFCKPDNRFGHYINPAFPATNVNSQQPQAQEHMASSITDVHTSQQEMIGETRQQKPDNRFGHYINPAFPATNVNSQQPQAQEHMASSITDVHTSQQEMIGEIRQQHSIATTRDRNRHVKLEQLVEQLRESQLLRPRQHEDVETDIVSDWLLHVMEYSILWLDCSPPTKANPPGSLTNFCTWESCRTMRVFSGIFPYASTLHSGAAPFSPHFTLIDTQDLVKRIPQCVCGISLHVTKWHCFEPNLHGNTARLARRSDEALVVRVSVARIATSLLDLGTRSCVLL